MWDGVKAQSQDAVELGHCKGRTLGLGDLTESEVMSLEVADLDVIVGQVTLGAAAAVNELEVSAILRVSA